jgi:hypothetical protein
MRDVLSENALRVTKQLAAAHGGQNVRVSPGGACPLFIVDMDEGRSLFDLVRLTQELHEALGIEVNVLTERSLSPYLRDAILAEAAPL